LRQGTRSSAGVLFGDWSIGFDRRKFIAWPCAAALAAVFTPFSASAQNKLPTIGFLGATSPTVWSPFVSAFQQRLRELGWVDGRNIIIEERWAQGSEQRYNEIAAEFVRLNVDVIVTSGTAPVLAAKKATSQIPIVFAAAGDPVGTHIVDSLARPGGNVTGLSNQQTDLAGQRLALLREVAPAVRRVAVLGNVTSANVALEMNGVVAAAPQLGLDVVMLKVGKAADIDEGLNEFKGRVDALYVCTDPLLTQHRVRINTFAIGEKLATMYAFREYVVAGGLMSYGPNFPDLFRRAGDYVDKILRGTKPADIPIEQPIKFDLIINLATAKALGLKIPDS
jgi:putative tryptophan/tyrosine transport system substrate-binding protein